MPTIQFRTDDQTKTASTALFKQLGITMSDAINLFLRQSVLRGGIPFALSIPKDFETISDILSSEALVDALRRYRVVNNKTDFDIAKAEPFLRAVEALGTQVPKRITLQDEAVKIKLYFKGQEYVLDYNFEEPNSVFILTQKDGKLIVKDCALSDTSKTLELF
jgi:addiction module RelB/DinJ family antitoxin